jgi:uracil-DNA glycosylase family 4
MRRARETQRGLFARTLEELRAEAERLAAGAAGATAGRLVFGEGNPEARVVLVGEAPGETEERLARPFVGRAGKLLDELLGEAGLSRDAVWITNVVKVRPTTGEGRARKNRPPRVGEVRAWLPLLEAEIAAIGPALALGLGAFAGRALIGPEFQLTRDRGAWFDGRTGVPVLVTYHPAYILRQQGEALAEARRLAAEDFRAVRARLDTAD